MSCSTKRKRTRKKLDLIKVVNSLDFAAFCRDYAPSSLKRDGEDTSSSKIRSSALLVSSLTENDCPESGKLSNADLVKCIDLIEKTSGDDYRKSAIGWNPEHKRRELGDKDMRYIIVTSNAHLEEQAPTLDGFIAFMFTYEDGLPVVYVYEIHIECYLRGKGVGSMLMGMVSDMGSNVGVDKIMLTVFRSNSAATAWYHKLGFELDEYSPPDKRLRSGVVKRSEYVILSKSLDRLKSRNS